MSKDINFYVTTDLHINHKALLEYESRPDNYESLIIKNHNYIVTDKDIVIILGDVCFGTEVMSFEEAWIKLFNPLKGRKILVKGNHDTKTTTWYLEHGFDFVCDSFSLYRYAKHILFTHKPKSLEELKDYDYNVHGHTHAKNFHKRIFNEKNILVSLELLNYTPIKLNKLIYP